MQEDVITDELLLSLYGEIINNVRKDREEIETILADFTDMILNQGDGSHSTKEAVVSLHKVKLETSDRLTKVAEIMTKLKADKKGVKLIEVNSTKRELIKKIEKGEKESASEE